VSVEYKQSRGTADWLQVRLFQVSKVQAQLTAAYVPTLPEQVPSSFLPSHNQVSSSTPRSPWGSQAIQPPRGPSFQ